MKIKRQREITVTLCESEIEDMYAIVYLLNRIHTKGWNDIADGELLEEIDELNRGLVKDLMDALK